MTIYISALIMSASSVIAYIISEGLIDSANAGYDFDEAESDDSE